MRLLKYKKINYGSGKKEEQCLEIMSGMKVAVNTKRMGSPFSLSVQSLIAIESFQKTS